MRDEDCAAFLQWALPQLRLRWPGFRKVRRQVCKRVGRRLKELDLGGLVQYRERLKADANEWAVLDAACRITISRFYRDRRVFDALRRDVLPALAEAARARGRDLRCWCAGSASGEEVYTIKIAWESELRGKFPDVGFDIIGTDSDPTMISRARQGCYSSGSLKDMPEDWLAGAFERSNERYCVKAPFQEKVTFLLQDIREEVPPGPFDLVLCRNLAFTYFVPELQRDILERITALIRPSGYLVIGAGETLPEGENRYRALSAYREIYRLATGS